MKNGNMGMEYWGGCAKFFIVGIILLLIAILVWGCVKTVDKDADPTKNVYQVEMNDSDYKIAVIDSCEYVVYAAWANGCRSYSGITHKGNCRNHKQ